VLKSAARSGPDLRIKRASVKRYRLCAELYDERVIAVPLSWFPKLYKAKPKDQQEWMLNKAGDEIFWKRLGLAITAAQRRWAGNETLHFASAYGPLP